ncbi:MAG: ABC transporter ATP-binding protein [Kiritimatiellae bacterium]|nr:ABC transporter ATP-binding protein [Kiritimatiellia bacterium]
MSVVIKDLTKTFSTTDGVVTAVDNINFEIQPGEFVGVHGPSGCGKSTLLLMLGSLLKPTTGSVEINGVDLYSLNNRQRTNFRADNIGFIFQEFHLIPYLNIHANIMLPSVAKAVQGADERATELAEKFNLSARISHVPSTLSVGEKQRVAMARALFLSPKLLLADEPTGNLDQENSHIILDHFKQFADDGGIVIMVTHDAFALKAVARTIAL